MSNQVSGSGFQVSGDAIQAQPVVNGDVTVSSQLSVVSDPATAQGNGGAQQTSVVSGQGTIQQPNTPTTLQSIPDPAVDEAVAQAKKVQDLFARNDALAATAQTPVSSVPTSVSPLPSNQDNQILKQVQDDGSFASQSMTTDNTQQSASDQPALQNPITNTQQPIPSSDDQKSPLDILEEILRKEEKKQAEKEAVVSQEETENQKQLEAQQEAENQALIEEARKKMIQETATEEQKQRDAIRQQQIDANKVHNPYEIRQLEHVKRGQG